MHRPISDKEGAGSSIKERAAEAGSRFGAGRGVACGENHPVGIELERENLLHGQQPVAFHARDVRRGQRQSRLREPVEIAGHEPWVEKATIR